MRTSFLFLIRMKKRIENLVKMLQKIRLKAVHIIEHVYGSWHIKIIN
jgi:hypothetical protein